MSVVDGNENLEQDLFSMGLNNSNEIDLDVFSARGYFYSYLKCENLFCLQNAIVSCSAFYGGYGI